MCCKSTKDDRLNLQLQYGNVWFGWKQSYAGISAEGRSRGGQTLKRTKGISQEHICGKRVSLPGGPSETYRRQRATGVSPGVLLMFRGNGDIGIQKGQDLHWYH